MKHVVFDNDEMKRKFAPSQERINSVGLPSIEITVSRSFV